MADQNYVDSDFEFVEAEATLKLADCLRLITAAHPELPREEKRRQAEAMYSEEGKAEYFLSPMFQIAKRMLSDEMHGFPIPPTYLSIKRLDREPIADWRAMQKIKNAICGKEWEGIEIYPAESRLVDTANQYHMFCFPESIPIYVFTQREVLTSQQAENRNENIRRLPDGKGFTTTQR